MNTVCDYFLSSTNPMSKENPVPLNAVFFFSFFKLHFCKDFATQERTTEVISGEISFNILQVNLGHSEENVRLFREN